MLQFHEIFLLAKNFFYEITYLDYYFFREIEKLLSLFIFILDFVSATCILAVYFNHQPDEIIFHTNFETITGNYWNIVSTIIGEKILKIRQIGRPTHVLEWPYPQFTMLQIWFELELCTNMVEYF